MHFSLDMKPHAVYYGYMKKTAVNKFNERFAIGTKVYPRGMERFSFAYIWSIQDDGTLYLYFPESQSRGGGWLPNEFSLSPVVALKSARKAYRECRRLMLV